MRRVKQRGSGLIEFAFGFPILVAVFIGMAQLAYTIVIFHQVSGAVRSGARYAASQDFDEPGHRFVRRVQDFVVYGKPEAGPDEPAQAPGLLPEHVEVTWTRDAAGVPDTVTVTIRDYSTPVLFQETQLNGRPRATVAYQGRWTPPGQSR